MPENRHRDEDPIEALIREGYSQTPPAPFVESLRSRIRREFACARARNPRAALRWALSASAAAALAAAALLAPSFTSQTARTINHGVRVIAEPGALWQWQGRREIQLSSGRLFLDVEPDPMPLAIESPAGVVKVLGTRLVVTAGGDGIRVALGSGEATLANGEGSIALGAGEEGIAREGQSPIKENARRFSSLAEFIAEDIEAEERSSIDAGEGFASGVARIPGLGGEASDLEVVRYHLDVHIEDGMARTTIDQIFYNPNWARVEGTFLFPLPPDASISRLAMYVDGRLMEGGMAERGRAAMVYEGIVRKMMDPAILEWMEGSTFRLRVFPFEPRSERRVILSYQQSLESLYEKDRYRFPILRPSGTWGEFSIRVRVGDGGGEGWEIETPTYPLRKVAASGGDVEFEYDEKDARPAKDVIVEIRRPRRPILDYASHEAEGTRMVCITATPEVSGGVYRGARRALIVADRSGNVSAAERRAQARLAKSLLGAFDRADRMDVLTYSTEPRLWQPEFRARTKEDVASALEFLAKETFAGAGDIAAALRGARDLFGEPQDGDVLFYLGDGIDTFSGVDPAGIIAILPPEIPFLAIPVNRSFDRTLLSALAQRSGGRVIPISPDDRIAWRAFDLVSALRTPSWRDFSFQLLDEDGKPLEGELHADRGTLREGESVRITGRIGDRWPRYLVLRGERFELPAPRTNCGWVPRLWAKLRIEALERESVRAHRDEIVRLGKRYYVMTPFTSLLVLENDAMYEEYRIDRGRSDHWAVYPAPKEWRGRTHKQRPEPDVWRTPWCTFPRSVWGTVWPHLSSDHNEVLDWMEGIESVVTVPEVETGSETFRVYPVTDILYRIRNFPGPRLDIGAPDDEGQSDGWFAFSAPEDEDDVILNPEQLIDFIREMTGGDEVWDSDTALEHFRGQLLVVAPPALHAKVARVLKDLRRDAVILSPDRPRRAIRSIVDAFYHPEREVSIGRPRSGESRWLEHFLPEAIDLAVSFGETRAILFGGGERMVIDEDRVLCFARGEGVVFDRLFERIFARGPGIASECSGLPWFLVPLEILTSGAHVDEHKQGDRMIVRIDGRGPAIVELVFRDGRPIEVRVMLRDGEVLQRTTYDDWQEIEGRSLPVHGGLSGPDGTVVEEITYQYGRPDEEDRRWLRRLKPERNEAGPTAGPELAKILRLYRAGDRPALESLLRGLDAGGRADDAIRKVARLAAIRWKSEPVIAAPPLAPDAPAVRRWLPHEASDIEGEIERSLERGDLPSFARLALVAARGEERFSLIERFRDKAPAVLRGPLDLWIGELADRMGWMRKAYEAYTRAAQWQPFAKSVAIQDRLSVIADGLNDVEAAINHAERALEILATRKVTAPLRSRYEKLAEIAGKNPEIWKSRGQAILDAWAQADPRDPKPFERLAVLYREAGRTAEAIRYASQDVELSPTPANYAKLAEELDRIGDRIRAAVCRGIAARSKG